MSFKVCAQERYLSAEDSHISSNGNNEEPFAVLG